MASANIVGYTTNSRPAGYQNFCGGSMFVNCAADSYTLADISITGPASKANARNNYIVLWAAGSTIKVDKNRSFWWDYSQSKWRVRSGTNFNNDPVLDDPTSIVINPGEGFMCNFGHDTTKITYSGSVIEGANQKLSLSRPAGYQNFVAVNPSGREITLNDITITGPTSKANARNNYIVFMATGSTIKVDKNRAYWWDYTQSKWRVRSGTNFNNDPVLDDPSTVTIGVGEGFLCNFGHDTTVLTMPSAL